MINCRWILLIKRPKAQMLLISLKSLINKQLKCLWFETPWRSCNVYVMTDITWRVSTLNMLQHHDDVIKWKRFPRHWPFVWEIHRSPVNSTHKGQWRGALMLSLMSAWINGWVNNREADDLRCHCAHYDVTEMSPRSANIEMPLVNKNWTSFHKAPRRLIVRFCDVSKI